MNALAIAQYGATILTSLPGLIKAGVEITGMIQMGQARMNAMIAENREPTADEWKELNGEINRLRADLHAAPSATPSPMPVAGTTPVARQ